MPLSDIAIKTNRVLQELEYLNICVYEASQMEKDLDECIKTKIETEILDRITLDDIAACIQNYCLLEKVEVLKSAMENGSSKQELLLMILEILIEKNPEFQRIKNYKTK